LTCGLFDFIIGNPLGCELQSFVQGLPKCHHGDVEPIWLILTKWACGSTGGGKKDIAALMAV
jgi:hypothetical protein